jgi:hypothetical protein
MLSSEKKVSPCVQPHSSVKHVPSNGECLPDVHDKKDIHHASFFGGNGIKKTTSLNKVRCSMSVPR